MELTKEQKKMALSPFAADDDYDRWGTGMNHMFAIADTLDHVAPYKMPSEWQFSHGASGRDCVQDILDCPDHNGCQCDWPQAEYVSFLDAGELGIAMLVYAGTIINYLLDREKAAGRDY